MTPREELDREIELTKLLGFLAAAYPNSQMTGESLKVYRAMLSDIPIEVLNVAVQQSVAENEFLPVPATLRKMCLRLTQREEMNGFEAWEVVRAAIGAVGSYRKPNFENALIGQAVNCIGWSQLCRSENEVADRAHFVKVFEQLKERKQRDLMLLPAARELAGKVLLFPNTKAKELKN